MLNGSSVNRAELMELIGKSIVGISDPVRQMFLSGKSNFLQQQIAHEQVVTNTTVQNPTLHTAMSDTATQLPVQNAVTPVQQPTHTLDLNGRPSTYSQAGFGDGSNQAPYYDTAAANDRLIHEPRRTGVDHDPSLRNNHDANSADSDVLDERAIFKSLDKEFSNAAGCILYARYSDDYDQHLAQPAQEPLVDPNVSNEKKKKREAYRNSPQINLDLASEFAVIGLLTGHAFPSSEKLREGAEDAILYARCEQVAIAYNSRAPALRGMFCE